MIMVFITYYYLSPYWYYQYLLTVLIKHHGDSIPGALFSDLSVARLDPGVPPWRMGVKSLGAKDCSREIKQR
jgi:hypothetical protein